MRRLKTQVPRMQAKRRVVVGRKKSMSHCRHCTDKSACHRDDAAFYTVMMRKHVGVKMAVERAESTNVSDATDSSFSARCAHYLLALPNTCIGPAPSKSALWCITVTVVACSRRLIALQCRWYHRHNQGCTIHPCRCTPMAIKPRISTIFAY